MEQKRETETERTERSKNGKKSGKEWQKKKKEGWRKL